MTAAVEAAARAWFDRGQAHRMDAGRKRPDGNAWQWEDLTEDDRRAYRATVEPIVIAALEAPSEVRHLITPPGATNGE